MINHQPARMAGFSLIELIGVLAILAILAGILAPNAVRMIDRAAVSAERETVRAVGEQTKLYLRSVGSPPSAANWASELALYADLSVADLATNKRKMLRRYIPDPAASPAPRVLLLSSMRYGLNLPTAANINTAGEFNQIWDTPDGSVPPSSSWTGWNTWSAVAGAGDYLVIERVNLRPVYATDLLSLSISLNNLGGSTVSYNVVDASGAAGASVDIAAGGTVVLSGLHPRDRVNLYAGPGGAALDYSYVLSSVGGTFDFDGTRWLPQ